MDAVPRCLWYGLCHSWLSLLPLFSPWEGRLEKRTRLQKKGTGKGGDTQKSPQSISTNSQFAQLYTSQNRDI